MLGGLVYLGCAHGMGETTWNGTRAKLKKKFLPAESMALNNTKRLHTAVHKSHHLLPTYEYIWHRIKRVPTLIRSVPSPPLTLHKHGRGPRE